MDFERDNRETERSRAAERDLPPDPRPDGEGQATGYAVEEPVGEPGVRRAGAARGTIGAEEEARLEEDVRRGARRALDEKEQEKSGGGGLYASKIAPSPIAAPPTPGSVGTSTR